ncbi:MAG TPA: ABC transporter ATP-binding protein [Phycisphaerales bacterium]|nr:ABC transporter ATP-binding protein [Phycisphaerales bacterium]
MLRYRALVLWTLAMALLSGGTLAAGIIGAKPVLEGILQADSQKQKDLRDLATDFNGALERVEGPLGRLTLRVPQSTIDALPEGPFTALAVLMGLLAVITVVGSVANFLHAYLSLTVVNRTITHIRREAFVATLRSPLKRVVGTGTSDTISRIVNDTGTLMNGLNVLMSKAVLQALKGVAGLAAALYYNWFVTVSAVLVAPALYTVIRKLGKKIKRAANAALQSQSELLGSATESLQALRVVKVYTNEVYEGGRFHRANKQVMRELNRVRTARALASPLTEMLSIFLLCGLTLAAGWVIIKGIKIDMGRFGGVQEVQVDPADFILAMISLAVAGASLKPLTGLINDIQASAPAAERLRQLIDAEPEPGHGGLVAGGEKLARLPRHAESVEFRDVVLTYPGASAPAVRGVSLRIPHGKRVAFVGPNGCGKTSLLSLVPRLFEPDAGTVLVDGHDVRGFSLRSLRSQVGVVTQETAIFAGTIRSNIAYGRLGASEAEIEAAAKQAHAHEFIVNLPRGYDTPVAEQGLSLSGGQRQRLAIARAVLRDPAILIMDEATSMVDAESEAQIAAAIADFSRGRTCLIVAHRLSTVLNCDSIVVMEAGQVVDQGTHEDLMGRCEVYRALAQHQFPT